MIRVIYYPLLLASIGMVLGSSLTVILQVERTNF